MSINRGTISVRIREIFGEIEKRLLKELVNYYGNRLVTVAIFGSTGRGTPTYQSDIDVLIIAEELPRGRLRRVEEFQKVEERLEPFLKEFEKDGVFTYLSPVFKTPEEALRGSLLFLDMIDDARILYDRNDFFKNLLERLNSRLRDLKAKRVWRGSTWHWVLKEGNSFEETIEI